MFRCFHPFIWILARGNWEPWKCQTCWGGTCCRARKYAFPHQITGEVKNETASPACVRPTSQLSQSIDTPPLFCQLGMLP